MPYTYAQRRRPQGQKETVPEPAAQRNAGGPQSAAADSAAAMRSAHRVDLPDAMRSKMESAFGADLSAVKLYESRAVGDAGAEAVTQGNEIAFAPGMLDFSSYGGQALLGHELSHVVSQQRGEVTGGGFLNDHALEARADREGAMAAAGQQIAMPTAALSTASAAPAAVPMQAKKATKEEKAAKKAAKAAKKRQEKAAKNVDRLYRIQAAKLSGRNALPGQEAGEGAAKISKKDAAFYEDMQENADYDTVREIDQRGKRAAKRLVQLREGMQGDDAARLDYEASWSDPALDMDIYNVLFPDMMNSPGAEQYAQEVEEIKLQNAGSPEEREAVENRKKATKITDANFYGTGISEQQANKYLLSEEGQADFPLRAAERQRRFAEIYMGKPKKKKK